MRRFDSHRWAQRGGLHAVVDLGYPNVTPATAQPPWLYTFGSFRLDPTRGLLHHNAEAIPLPDRLLQLLLALIAANGGIVDKDALAAELWPDGDVSDGNLSQHMYMLRRLLGESARDRSYIMTVHGRGYRFAAPVSVVSPVEIAAQSARAPGSEKLLRSGLEVFRHFSNGSYQLERRRAGALHGAIEHFEAALAIDPDYTPALVGLAQSYAFMAEYWYAPASCTFPHAKFAVMRALKLDPASAVAHATLSNIMLFCDWDWKGAKRESETALRLNQNAIFACANSAWYHVCSGDRERAMDEMQRCLLLDPSAPPLQILFGRMLLHTAEYSAAIDFLTNLIESGPEFECARRHRAQALILSGRPAEALVDLMLLPVDRAEDVALRLPLLARAYADCGEVDRASELYATLQSMAAHEYVVRWNLASVAVALGRHDEALDYLEKGLEDREPTMLLLRSYPWFEPIARHSRFKALLRAVGP